MTESFLTKWERVIKATPSGARRIPEDLAWTADDGAHENIPLGKIIAEQAGEIDRLRNELEVSEACNRVKTELLADVVELLSDEDLPADARLGNAKMAISLKIGAPKS